MYDGPLDEDATHVLPTESRDVEKGIAVVDGMAIFHKMQSTALGTVVDLSHGFNDQHWFQTVGSMMRSYLSLTLTRMYL